MTLCHGLWKNGWRHWDAVCVVDLGGPRKHVLGGVHTDANWWIPLNCPCAVAMRFFCQITLTTCSTSVQKSRLKCKKCVLFCICQWLGCLLVEACTHTHVQMNSCFPDQPGLADCRFHLLVLFVPDLCSVSGLFISSLSNSLVPSASIAFSALTSRFDVRKSIQP